MDEAIGRYPADHKRSAAMPLLHLWQEEFGFIKSLVLEVPQRAVLALAHNPNVRYISPDGPVQRTIDASQLKTTYPQDVNAPSVWNSGSTSTQATGSGVTVAVLDTGFNEDLPDFDNAAVQCLNVNVRTTSCSDADGHGTAVSGIIRGRDTQGRYIGVAPNSRILSIQVLGSNGSGAETDVVRGLQWVFDNRTTYNIKIVNLSLVGSVAESYLTAPISGALEQLWLNGVVVVAAAGNYGSASAATWYEPGNDPFVISVGALDDNGTATPTDDSLASFSSRGLTQDGIYKPEICGARSPHGLDPDRARQHAGHAVPKLDCRHQLREASRHVSGGPGGERCRRAGSAEVPQPDAEPAQVAARAFGAHVPRPG